MLQKVRAEKVDEENRVICLVSMFPSWVMVRKFSKKVHFHNFVLTLARNLNLLKQFIYIHLKVLITLFQKMVKFIGVQATVRSHVFFLNLISTKNPSNDESVFSNYEGISSLIYSRMPPPFALLSNLGLHNLLNKIVLKEKKNQFLFQISMQISGYWCFTTYIFQSFMGFRVSSSIKIWWNFIRFFKNLIPLYRFMARVTKIIWLTYLMTMLKYWVSYSHDCCMKINQSVSRKNCRIWAFMQKFGFWCENNSLHSILNTFFNDENVPWAKYNKPNILLNNNPFSWGLLWQVISDQNVLVSFSYNLCIYHLFYS